MFADCALFNFQDWVTFSYTCAPVAQGIEHRPPEAGAQVRFLSGARDINHQIFLKYFRCVLVYIAVNRENVLLTHLDAFVLSSVPRFY